MKLTTIGLSIPIYDLFGIPALAALILVLPYTCNPQVPPPPTKIESFLEGLCIGLGIGLTADTLIVIGIKCWKHNHPPSTNAPPVEPPAPPPTTNRPPPPIGRVIIYGDEERGVTWYSNGSFRTELHSSSNLSEWTPTLTITGWPHENGTWVVLVESNSVPVWTNNGPLLQALPLMLPQGNQRFHRLVAP